MREWARKLWHAREKRIDEEKMLETVREKTILSLHRREKAVLSLLKKTENPIVLEKPKSHLLLYRTMMDFLSFLYEVRGWLSLFYMKSGEGFHFSSLSSEMMTFLFY